MKNVLFVLKYIMVDTSVLSDTFNLLHGNKNGKLKKKQKYIICILLCIFKPYFKKI